MQFATVAKEKEIECGTFNSAMRCNLAVPAHLSYNISSWTALANCRQLTSLQKTGTDGEMAIKNKSLLKMSRFHYG